MNILRPFFSAAKPGDVLVKKLIHTIWIRPHKGPEVTFDRMTTLGKHRHEVDRKKLKKIKRYFTKISANRTVFANSGNLWEAVGNHRTLLVHFAELWSKTRRYWSDTVTYLEVKVSNFSRCVGWKKTKKVNSFWNPFSSKL